MQFMQGKNREQGLLFPETLDHIPEMIYWILKGLKIKKLLLGLNIS